MQKKQAEHYVDNKEFLQYLIIFKDLTAEARERGESDPRIPDVLGEIFVKIASHLSYKSNFINYGFREDMIADGIENCIQYIHNFDPNKSRNPFAYFTQIIYYAFLRRIQKEKKQLYVRYKTLENTQIVSELSGEEDRAMGSSIGIPQLYDNMREFIENYEESMKKKKEIKSKQRKTTKKKKKKDSTSNSVLQFAKDGPEEKV
jgi:DNA-directed RNA polymerase specialized sigma subunit